MNTTPTIDYSAMIETSLPNTIVTRNFEPDKISWVKPGDKQIYRCEYETFQEFSRTSIVSSQIETWNDSRASEKQINSIFLPENSKMGKAVYSAIKFHELQQSHQNYIVSIAGLIERLPYNDFLFEFLENKSSKWTIAFSDDRLLVINYPSPEEGFPSPRSIIFSFFVGRQLIDTDVEDYDKYFSEFSRYINM
jgi:hypothetical protein